MVKQAQTETKDGVVWDIYLRLIQGHLPAFDTGTPEQKRFRIFCSCIRGQGLFRFDYVPPCQLVRSCRLIKFDTRGELLGPSINVQH